MLFKKKKRENCIFTVLLFFFSTDSERKNKCFTLVQSTTAGCLLSFSFPHILLFDGMYMFVFVLFFFFPLTRCVFCPSCFTPVFFFNTVLFPLLGFGRYNWKSHLEEKEEEKKKRMVKCFCNLRQAFYSR